MLKKMDPACAVQIKEEFIKECSIHRQVLQVLVYAE